MKAKIILPVARGLAVAIMCLLLNITYAQDKVRATNAFTNKEEVAVKPDKVVPFLLESTLVQRDAIFQKADPWQSHVVVDQRAITRQNLQSAEEAWQALVKEFLNEPQVAMLTRYNVKKGYQKKFRKVIRKYIKRANARESNIMAEAYYEEENPSILWTIERWNDQHTIERFHKGSKFKLIKLLSKHKLAEAPRIIYVKDLEPISKNDWRRSAAKEDKPITIMLFVDSKVGTEERFKATYHAAMPKFRSEAGVINYQLSQLKDDSTQFVTYEKFRNEDAFQYHLNFPPIKPVIDYLNTSIRQQPFQTGLHRLIGFAPVKR